MGERIPVKWNDGTPPLRAVIPRENQGTRYSVSLPLPAQKSYKTAMQHHHVGQSPMNAPVSITPPYRHSPLFPLGADTTPYRKITSDGVRVEKVMGEEVVVVSREALRALAEAAFGDISHLLRPGHLKQLRAILEDPEASDNDKFVAYDFLKNANIAAGGILPMCQDTGTAIIMGKKGRLVWTDGNDEAALAEGARDAYLKRNLRYSQLAPLTMFEEKNTRNNLPAQVEIYAEGQGDSESAYKFLFIAKGGGSANKAFLYQATPSILTHDRMTAFLKEKVLTLGTAACPPYHLAIVIGGTSAELTMRPSSSPPPSTTTACRPKARRTATLSLSESSSANSSPDVRRKKTSNLLPVIIKL
jgi:fumarate hydratase, class I